MFALIDCNCFFVSCERLFNPRLANRPVVVLSNNDGCAVSRSNEAKALGVQMGAPYFQFRDLARRHGIVCLSSNFELYADLSRRVMSLFDRWSPDVEVYSIDEAFLRLRPQSPEQLRETAETIRATVGRWTGIPVSVGVASTKTLAKAANDAAKKDLTGARVLQGADAGFLLAEMAARDVWGIGRNLSRWLEERNIRSALALRDAPPAWIRQHLGVTVERTVLELRGVSCLPLNTQPGDQKNMAHMRSFARPVEAREAVGAAVRHHAERAAANLRREGLAASAISVHLFTDRHRPDLPQHRGAETRIFPVPTSFTPEIVARALDAFSAAFAPGFRYKKAGVVMHDLVRPAEAQADLFDAVDRPRADRLMAALDGVQARHGTTALQYGYGTFRTVGKSGTVVTFGTLGTSGTGSRGNKAAWQSKSDRRTPRFTTRWEELAGAS